MPGVRVRRRRLLLSPGSRATRQSGEQYKPGGNGRGRHPVDSKHVELSRWPGPKAGLDEI
jgi:hypothetical protein